MPLFRENVKTREEGGLRWDYHSFKAREICTQVGGVARDVERKGKEGRSSRAIQWSTVPESQGYPNRGGLRVPSGSGRRSPVTLTLEFIFTNMLNTCIPGSVFRAWDILANSSILVRGAS